MPLDQETIDLTIKATNLTTKELKKASKDLKNVGDEAIRADEKLEKLTVERQQLERFVELKNNIKKTITEIDKAETANKRYSKSIKESGKQTAAQTRKLQSNKRELKDLNTSLRKSKKEQDEIGESLKSSGIGIVKYNQSLTRLNQKYKESSSEVKKLNRVYRKQEEVLDKAQIKDKEAIESKNKLINSLQEEAIEINQLIDVQRKEHEINQKLLRDSNEQFFASEKLAQQKAKEAKISSSLAKQNRDIQNAKKRQVEIDKQAIAQAKEEAKVKESLRKRLQDYNREIIKSNAQKEKQILLDKQSAVESERLNKLRSKEAKIAKSLSAQLEISNRRKKRQIEVDKQARIESDKLNKSHTKAIIENKKLNAEKEKQIRTDKESLVESNRVIVATRKYEKELKKLNLQLKKGKISHDQFIKSERRLRKELKLTEKQAKKTGIALNKVNHKKASRSTDLLTKTTRRLAQAYTVLIAAQTAAAAVGESVKSYGELESAMVKVEKTTDLTKQQLVELTDQFIKMSSKSTPTATNELLRFAEVAGQLGAESTEDILRIASAADALAVSTDLAGDEAVTLLTRMLQMTGEGIPAIGNLASSMVELGNNTAATESEIAQMTKDIITGTSSIKLSTAAAAGFGATLKEMGQAGERSRSSLFKLSQAIKDASVNGGKQLEQLSRITGKTGDQIERDLGEKPERVLLAFVKGLKKVKDEGGLVSETLTEFGITGVEATSVIEVLADKSERLERNIKLSNDAFKDGTKHLLEATKAYATQDAQIGRLINRFTQLKTAVGEALADETSDSVEFLNTKLEESEVFVQELANSFGEMIKGLGEAFTSLDESINGTGNVISAMGTQVRILFNGIQTSFRLINISIVGLRAAMVQLQISWNEFFNDDGAVRRRKEELKDLRAEFKRLNDGIRQDSEDMVEALSDFEGKSSSTYRNLIQATTKYSLVVDKLSDKEKIQLEQAKKSFAQGEESTKLYIKLTARLVQLNNQRKAEIELIKKTTEQREKDNEAIRKTNEDLKKVTNLINQQGITVEGLKDRLVLLNTEYELTGAVASQFANDQKRLANELEKSEKSYGEIAEKLRILTAEFNAGGTDIKKYLEEQIKLEEQLSDIADEMVKTGEAIDKNSQAMVKGGEATKKYNREIAITETAIEQLTETQNKGNKTISESIVKTDLLIETYGHNAEAILTLVNAQQDLEQSKDKLEKRLSQLTVKNKEYETTLLELQKVTEQLAQTESDLKTIRELENLTLQELIVVQREHNKELELINLSYEKGQITLAQRDEQLGKLKFKTDFLNEAIGENTDEVGENTEALEENNAEKEKAIEYTSSLLVAQNKLTEEFNFSSETIEDLNKRYKELDSQIITVTSSTGDWWRQSNVINNQAVRREQAIIKETIALRELQEQVESGSLSLAELEKASKRAEFSFRNLGDQQLDPLRDAIKEAREEFQDLQDTINDSFNDVEDRLDAILGNEKDIVKRKFEREMQELLDLLEQAQSSGDRGLINKINEAIRKLEQAQKLEFKEQFGESNSKRSSNSNNDVDASSTSSNRNVTVTLNLNGNTTSFDFANQNSADAFIASMEALGEINSEGIG